MKKVSIVLPVYNGEENLDKSIESVINQTYKDWELIIVDDCSTDGSPEIIKRYVREDNRIRLIRNSENMKLPASLNKGFQSAEGDFFSWTSDDNVYINTAIERMVNVLEKNNEVGLIYCDTELIDSTGKMIKNNPLKEPQMLLYGNTVGACFLYRREVKEKIGEYDVNMFLAEDYDYWFRIYQNYKILHINTTLYQYRCHENSLSTKRLRDIKLQTWKIWKKNFEYIVENSESKRKLCYFFDDFIEYQQDKDLMIQTKVALKKNYKYYGLYCIGKKIGIKI